MKLNLTPIALLAALFLAGCAAPAKDAAAPETKPAEAADQAKPAPSDASKDDAGKPGDTNTSPSDDSASAKPSAAVLPSALKNVAYEYYGLSNTKPVKLELRMSDNPTVRTGEQSVTFLGMSGDDALFLVKRSGDLSIMGDSEVKLTKDGVYSTKLAGKEVMPPQVEIPVDLTPGRSWKTSSKVEMDQPGATGMVEQSGVMKVVGFEKVKTKLGTFDALVLQETGVAKMNGTDNKITSKVWYAKGIGAVKMEVKNTVDKTTQTLNFDAVP